MKSPRRSPRATAVHRREVHDVPGRRAAPPARPAVPVLRILVPLMAAAAGAFAYRNTLAYYFSQDAFTVLARVRGLAELPAMGWRWLSGDLYFRLGDHLFGLDPRPYRVMALALHAANAALVAMIGQRLGLGAAAAFFAAVFFAVHYSHFDALYSIAGAGELLATTFVLAALVVALPGERAAQARWRWPVALACYAAALMSKENVLLLPVLLWLVVRMRPSAARAAIIPAFAMAVLYVIRFVALNPFGAWAGSTENPYRLTLGRALLDTWSTYLAWALALFDTRWDHLVNETGHESLGWWFMAGLALVLILLWRRQRVRGETGAPAFRAALLGTAGYTAFILPVLPLSAHTGHHYLYLPIGMLALALGAALEAWVSRRVPALVWLAALVVMGFGVVMVQSIEFGRLADSSLPRQGTVRRAVVAERVLKALPVAPVPPPDELVMLGPNAMTPAVAPDTSARSRYLYHNFSAALDQGNAVRLRYPSVRKVTLRSDLGPWVRSPDVMVFDYEGGLERGPTAWLYLKRAQVFWSAGHGAEAVEASAGAEDMTSRWLREVAPGPWRDEGVAVIRAQVQAMQSALEKEVPSTGDPGQREWPAYREGLRRILALVS